MKTLSEFLTTANVDDELALAEAQVYAETKGKLISPDMMLAFLTGFNLIDILDSPSDNPATPMTKEAKGLRKAFSFGSEFNLIEGHPSSQLALLTQMQADSIVTPEFVAYCVAYANPASYPLKDTTLKQVKVIRNPASWIDCDQSGQPYTISTSYNDVFTFAATLAESMNTISIRCYWATAVGEQEYLSQSKVIIPASDNLNISQSFTRSNLGLPTTARILRFEYTSAYDGVVTSVNVSK